MLLGIHQLSTVPVRYALPALRELERLGYSRRDLYTEAGVQVSDDLVESDDLVLSVVEFGRLYGLALAWLEMDTSDRENRHLSHKERLDTICYVAIACPDLRSVIDRIAVLFRVTRPDEFNVDIVQSGNVARLKLDLHRNRNDAATMIVTLASMSFFYQLFSWVIGKRVSLLGLEFRCSEAPDPMPVMPGLLHAPHFFDQSSDAILFHAKYLDQPVIRTYSDLIRVIDFMPLGLSYSDHDDVPLAARVRAMLVFAMQHELALMPASAVAEDLHMSEASLRRNLRAEETTYADIKSSCQREFAEYLLSSTDASVTEIAIRIGFGEDRAFRRAFRQWTGMSPSEYRDAYRQRELPVAP